MVINDIVNYSITVRGSEDECSAFVDNLESIQTKCSLLRCLGAPQKVIITTSCVVLLISVRKHLNILNTTNKVT